MKTEFSGTCDWCKKPADDLVEHKDFEEGQAGRFYDVCGACREKESLIISAELDALDDDEAPYGFEPECYMDSDGYCSAAGSEHCDWDCPNGGC
jgi:hypothetical protein